MTTQTISVEEIEELFKNEPTCEFHLVNFDTGVVAFTCPNAAEWIHICKFCGHPGFKCDQHHRYQTENPTNVRRRCSKCKTVVNDYRDMLLSFRRV